MITWHNVRQGDVLFHDHKAGSPVLIARKADNKDGTVTVDLLRLDDGKLFPGVRHWNTHVACYALLRNGEEVK